MNQENFDFQVAIIGTGFAGVGAGIALDRVGISDYVMLEKSTDIGGTWRDNQYPGACCDVPSQLYSFSFELNPDWSHRYSPAAEIHIYLRNVIDKYKLKARIRCNFEVDTAGYIDGGWQITNTNGEKLRVRYLISAIGALHIPNKPEFAGLDRFEGKLMHSAEWDKTYDFTDRKIVVVGSAASAIQIIPQLAKVASHVSVIQRSPSYFYPRRDRVISGFEKLMLRWLPFLPRIYRWRQYALNDFLLHSNFVSKASFSKRLVHFIVRWHFSKQMHDKDLADKLTPDYEIGCKRLLLSDNFLPAMQQANVSLVTEGIDHFTERGLVIKGRKEIDADLVVFATGFQVTKLFGHMTIKGPGGLTMDQAWASEIRAHRSVAVNGFPNFFMMYGPNSNLGHNSIIVMIEAQAKYIARLLNHSMQSGKATITVRPEAEEAFNKGIQKALQSTVWNSGCSNWYKDKNGHIFSLWPYSATRFIWELRKAPLDEYTFK